MKLTWAWAWASIHHSCQFEVHSPGGLAIRTSTYSVPKGGLHEDVPLVRALIGSVMDRNLVDVLCCVSSRGGGGGLEGAEP